MHDPGRGLNPIPTPRIERWTPTSQLHPGQKFSPETFKRLDGADYTFDAPGQWQALFVFRGQHCPICKAYLGKIEAQRGRFER